MRTSRLLLALAAFVCLFAITTTPVYVRSEFLSGPSPANPAPVANDDAYTVHVGGDIGPMFQNDSGVEGMQLNIVSYPAHGTLSGTATTDTKLYQSNDPSYVGTDTFTYKACDFQACSNTATVTITIVNRKPVAGNDSYNVHGGADIGPMLVNDTDPDGDQISWVFLSAPAHGTLTGLAQPDMKNYQANYGFTGVDTFTYKACDSFNLCSDPATVTLSVANNAPVAGSDQYRVIGAGIIGPMLANDSDPDGDGFNGPAIVMGGASHGIVYGLPYPNYPNDVKQYVPDAGFAGTDSFQYEICDVLGACSRTAVTLWVPGDGENDGPCSGCNKGGPAAVAEPINVTNGNMYVQQSDYSLPSVGYDISITRTFNSNSQQTGIFGRGWSSDYDESIGAYDNSLVRFNQSHGRAIYLGRAIGSSGVLRLLKETSMARSCKMEVTASP